MALTKDEAGRQTAAPTPRRLPKPKPADDGPRAERSRTEWKPDFRGPAAKLFTQARQQQQEQAPQPYVELPRKPVRPPALAPRSKQAVMAYNQKQTEADERTAQNERVARTYQAMATAQQRDEKRLAREKADRKETEKVMSSKEWAALTPLQQAAVQANADLAAAIKADFSGSTKHKASTEQIQSYMNRVDELFGEDGSVGFKGIDFAPNTVSFLNERGLDKDALAGKTLDDFISGDVLMTQEQIAELGKPEDKGSAFKVVDGGRALAERLAKGQLQYQEDLAAKLAKGKQLLAGQSATATGRAAEDTYGAQAMERPRFPDIQPQTMQQIDLYMEALARTDSPIDQALNAISLDMGQRGISGKEAEQVFQEMQERSRAGMTGEGRWFDGLDFPMRSPVEVAQALGSPTLKRAALGQG